MNKNILKTQYTARNRRLKQKDITYQEFLKSELWKETKEYVKQFPEFQKCWICGSTDKLNIHHFSYRWMFELKLKKRKNGLRCLCQKCHYKIHELAQENNWGLKQSILKYKKSLQK